MSDLKRVVELANQLTEATAKVTALTDELKEAEAVRLSLEREDLPMLMEEIGLTELKLGNGQKIKVISDCTASITIDNSMNAIKWLVENGFGGLVKTCVVIEFDRGEVDKAQTTAKGLTKKFPQTISKETVHHSTLKSFIKEQLADAQPIPMELFGVHTFSKAVISK